jgi:hypothetical protein
MSINWSCLLMGHNIPVILWEHISVSTNAALLNSFILTLQARDTCNYSNKPLLLIERMMMLFLQQNISKQKVRIVIHIVCNQILCSI